MTRHSRREGTALAVPLETEMMGLQPLKQHVLPLRAILRCILYLSRTSNVFVPSSTK
jgi:hypothetical protein